MTVHAAVFLQVVVGKRFLVPVLNAPLFDLQFVPYFIVGFYQAIGDVWIYAVGSNGP